MKKLNLGKVKEFCSPVTKFGDIIKEMDFIKVVILDDGNELIVHSDIVKKCEIGEDLIIEVDDYLILEKGTSPTTLSKFINNVENTIGVDENGPYVYPLRKMSAETGDTIIKLKGIENYRIFSNKITKRIKEEI